MTWVRKDDQMPIHRKVAPLSDAAYRLEDEAMCWASRNLTDGVIRQADLTHTSKRGQPKYAAELVRQELWHTADDACDACLTRLSEGNTVWPMDGWVIHDFLDYNPSRAQVTKERVGRAQRQQRWRDTKRNASSNGHVDALRNAPVDAAPSRPVPPRPEGRRGGDRPAAPDARHPAGPGGDGRTTQCRDHPGQPAHNCAACRSEQLGGVA